MTIGMFNEIIGHKWTPQWIQREYNQTAELNKDAKIRYESRIQETEIMKNNQTKIPEIISKIK